MLSYLPRETQLEIEQLSARYGQPLVRLVDLGINNYFDPLEGKNRAIAYNYLTFVFPQE